MDFFLQSASGFEWLGLAAVLIAGIWLEIAGHKPGHKITTGNALMWTGVWVAVSVAFCGYIALTRGADAGAAAISGWALEKSLALDNLAVFITIFAAFGLNKPEYEHYQLRILYWGILSAIFFRLLFLSTGAFVLGLNPLIFMLFAVIVLWSAMKMLTEDGDDEVDYAHHGVVRFVRRFVPVVPSVESGKFFVGGAVTPLFLCMIVIEISDVLFAFDSMPTIIAVVKDPFPMIGVTMLAVMGLRSLYFVFESIKDRFWFLEYGIIGLLFVIAGKLALGALFHIHIEPFISAAIVLGILVGSVIISVMFPQKDDEEEESEALSFGARLWAVERALLYLMPIMALAIAGVIWAPHVIEAAMHGPGHELSGEVTIAAEVWLVMVGVFVFGGLIWSLLRPKGHADNRLFKTVVADGIISADEVNRIRKFVYQRGHGRITRPLAEWLFKVNNAVSGNENDPSWRRFFVDALVQHVLEDSDSPHELDAMEWFWLKERINEDDIVDDVEQEILRRISAEANAYPDDYLTFCRSHNVSLAPATT